jgi:hypothetical protein
VVEASQMFHAGRLRLKLEKGVLPASEKWNKQSAEAGYRIQDQAVTELSCSDPCRNPRRIGRPAYHLRRHLIGVHEDAQ